MYACHPLVTIYRFHSTAAAAPTMRQMELPHGNAPAAERKASQTTRRLGH